MPHTEDSLVQKPTADLLKSLGWESVLAHHEENFGADGLLGRADDKEVVLTRPCFAACK